MNRSNVEISVGLFVIVGLACLTYLALNVGGVSRAGADDYVVMARFVSSSGLKRGAGVEVAGVPVGRVTDISFEPESYLAVVEMALDKAVILQEDAIASIRTTGIIGDKFVKITPGGSDIILESGDEIIETEPSISLEELISKYIFESGK